MVDISRLKEELRNAADPEQAKNLHRFFKTGKGEYGEGDVFLGIKVPVQRKIAGKYRNLPLKEIIGLLQTNIHEHRLVSLVILIHKYNKTNEEGKREIFNLYLKNTGRINNWDLIDLSAPKIVGHWLLDKKRDILYKLARSSDLWEKRIGIMASFAFIKHKQSEDALNIAEILLHDEHDLIHKAVGWMLREVGNRVSRVEEEKFLKKHYKIMPRTMLRYAIEKFDEEKRRFYMNTG
jgi:3-methyladenine DNA glycosylase AlkD